MNCDIDCIELYKNKNISKPILFDQLDILCKKWLLLDNKNSLITNSPFYLLFSIIDNKDLFTEMKSENNTIRNVLTINIQKASTPEKILLKHIQKIFINSDHYKQEPIFNINIDWSNILVVGESLYFFPNSKSKFYIYVYGLDIDNTIAKKTYIHKMFFNFVYEIVDSNLFINPSQILLNQKNVLDGIGYDGNKIWITYCCYQTIVTNCISNIVINDINDIKKSELDKFEYFPYDIILKLNILCAIDKEHLILKYKKMHNVGNIIKINKNKNNDKISFEQIEEKTAIINKINKNDKTIITFREIEENIFNINKDSSRANVALFDKISESSIDDIFRIKHLKQSECVNMYNAVFKNNMTYVKQNLTKSLICSITSCSNTTLLELCSINDYSQLFLEIMIKIFDDNLEWIYFIKINGLNFSDLLIKYNAHKCITTILNNREKITPDAFNKFNTAHNFLEYSIKIENILLIKLCMLDKYYDWEKKKYHYLKYALCNGCSKALYYFIKYDQNIIKYIDDEKNNLMHLLLLKLNNKHNLDETHQEQYLNCMRVLIKMAPELINQQNIYYVTPLHNSTLAPSSLFLQLLLENTADGNIVDNIGQNYVHWIGQYGTTKMVELVVVHNYSLLISTDDFGRTPYGTAYSFNNMLVHNTIILKILKTKFSLEYKMPYKKVYNEQHLTYLKDLV